MKKIIVPIMIGLCACTLLTGCLAIQLGGGSTTHPPQPPTVGQQLVDLKHALDTGAITQAEYDTEKTKLLGGK